MKQNTFPLPEEPLPQQPSYASIYRSLSQRYPSLSGIVTDRTDRVCPFDEGSVPSVILAVPDPERISAKVAER
jgi:hypothetical protein